MTYNTESINRPSRGEMAEIIDRVLGKNLLTAGWPEHSRHELAEHLTGELHRNLTDAELEQLCARWYASTVVPHGNTHGNFDELSQTMRDMFVLMMRFVVGAERFIGAVLPAGSSGEPPRP